MPQASSHSYPWYRFTPTHTAVLNSIKTNLEDREATAKWIRESVMRDREE